MINKESNSAFYNTELLAFFITQAELLVRRRKLVTIIFFIIVLPVFIRLLFSDPVYTAEIIILPPQNTGTNAISRLGGIPAGLLGLDISIGGDLSLIYEDIIRSKTIAREILNTKFETNLNESKIKLIDYFDIEREVDFERFERAKEKYDDMIVIVVNKQSRKATIFVTTLERDLSAKIANLLVNKLNDYLRKISSDKASDTRSFIEERLEITKELLSESEENLKQFRENNKRIENSPDLQLNLGRLMREQKIQEEIFLVLKKEYETAKIEEVKNIPVVRVLDPAEPPAFKSGPQRRRIMLVAILLGGLLAVGVAYYREFWSYASKDDTFMHRLSLMTLTLKSDVSNLKNWIKIKFKRKPDNGNLHSE